jgi:phage antirepressor YoqD-like protein
MNALIVGGSPLSMTSREIGVLCEKEHRHVLADIRNMLSQLGLDSAEFSAQYKDSTGRALPCFNLNKELTLTLVSGYSVVLRKRIIDRWMELESAPPSAVDPMAVLNDPAAMRGLLLTYSEKVIALEGKVAEQAPKVEIHDRISESLSTLCIRDAAKTLQVQPSKLTAWLVMNKWIYHRAGKSGYLAYQDRIQSGHLVHKSTPYRDSVTGDDKISEQVRITGRGLTALAQKLADDGFMPAAPGGAAKPRQSPHGGMIQ